MTASLEGEWLKLVTTRAFPGLVFASALVTAFVSFGLVAQGPPPWELAAGRVGQLAGVDAIVLGLFCLLLGLRTYTEEFRYGTIVTTAFVDPHRTRTILAKLVVAAAGGAVLCALSLLLSGGVVFAMASLSGGSLDTNGVLPSVLGLMGGGLLWAMLGVGLGAIIRQPAPAVATALLWVLVFENVAGLFLGPVTRYLPGQSGQVLARGLGTARDVPLAAGVMTAWAGVFVLVGWIAVRRRDVA